MLVTPTLIAGKRTALIEREPPVNATSTRTAHVLIVGRSPGVLLDAVDILRGRGFRADATNQFDDVLTDYDAPGVDVLVFGGMVPADMKQYLSEQVSALNPEVIIVQGFGGIPGLIAAQVEAAVGATNAAAAGGAAADVAFDADERSLRITLAESAYAVVEAWWGTSFQPPEPQSAHAVVFTGELTAGRHEVALPEHVPSQASFTAARVAGSVHVFTVGGLPERVTRLAPASAADQRLPEVAKVSTGSRRERHGSAGEAQVA